MAATILTVAAISITSLSTIQSLVKELERVEYDLAHPLDVQIMPEEFLLAHS
jgi:hypothetical protein